MSKSADGSAEIAGFISAIVAFFAMPCSVAIQRSFDKLRMTMRRNATSCSGFRVFRGD
jgi:hypothetical protein